MDPQAEAAVVPVRNDVTEIAQALACLAPATLLFAGVLYGVPAHTAAAAGWVLLSSLPALLLALALRRQVLVRGLHALLVLLSLALYQVLTRTDLDTFEARRALLVLSSWLALMLSSSRLGPRGRRLFAHGLTLLAIAGLAFSWLDTLTHPVRSFAGALENSGDLSESVLPGALIGYALALSARGPWRVLGMLAAGLFLLTAGRAPVLAGGLSFLIAVGLAGILNRSTPRNTRVLAGLLALLVFCGAYFTTHGTPGPTASAHSSQASEPDATLGGVSFRRLTWARVPGMVLDHPWLGVGPGQFPRRFPVYRDPREIELSSLARQAQTSTEVEHAHNDWLQPFAEYGLLGGCAWLLFGLLAAARALSLLAGKHGSGQDGTRALLALGALGMLANAGANSPFFEGPAYAIAAPLLGILLGSGSVARSRAWRAPLALVASLGLSLALVPDALGFVRHGLALAPLAREATTRVDGRTVHSAAAKATAIDAALVARPDSTVALVERAFLERAMNAPEEAQIARWQDVLRVRPYHLEALMAVANLLARAEQFDDAKEYYARAAEVDPHNPQLGRNTLLLALHAGDIENVLAGLSRESERGSLEPEWFERSAAELLLSGRPHLGLPLLQRVHPDWQITSSEEAYALSGSLAADGRSRLLADALLAHAHFGWAREHADGGDFASAVRSYRQCLKVADSYPDLRGGARRVRLEQVAAESLRGEAPDPAGPGSEASKVDLRELPDWALVELTRIGWPGAPAAKGSSRDPE